MESVPEEVVEEVPDLDLPEDVPELEVVEDVPEEVPEVVPEVVPEPPKRGRGRPRKEPATAPAAPKAPKPKKQALIPEVQEEVHDGPTRANQTNSSAGALEAPAKTNIVTSSVEGQAVPA